MIIYNFKKFFFKKKNNTKKIKDILNNIIEISYSNSFNNNFSIPKNFYSRYEIIVILIFLLYIRFKNEKKNKTKIQIIYDNLFFILVGSTFWIAGFILEVISDMQKRKFKKSNGNGFITFGLWAYSRHPNYLGEIILWIGICIISIPSLQNAQFITLISPLFVYLLLTRISGINLLEEYADNKWGELESYQEYKKSTPILFPFKK